MWKNTSRTVLKHNKIHNNIDVVDKTLSKPPFNNADYILPGGLGGWTEYGPAITDITYYSILRILSSTIGKLPFHVRGSDNKTVDNSAEKLLNVRPNQVMTPCELFTYLEFCRNEYGNGYAYCDWSGATGELKSITALDPRCVRVYVDNSESEILQKIYYVYTTWTGSSFILPAEDVIHVRNWHLDSQTHTIGVPVKDTLRSYVNASMAGQETQTNLYKSGMIIGGVLNYNADLSEEQKNELLDRVKKIGTKYKIVPLPSGWDLKPINMSMQDMQLLEGRKFTLQQLGAAFGVSPVQLNDYSKGSYANSVQQQLQFLSDWLMHAGRVYADELSYKLLSDKEISEGLRVDVDTEAVLLSSPETLTDCLVKLVGGGSIMTINEARNKANLPPIDGGNRLMAMPGATEINIEDKVIV